MMRTYNGIISKRNDFIHIPIWYIFKNGKKIDLNSPFFIIEDYNIKYAIYIKLGKIKIESWKRHQKFFLFGKDLPPPHIVFYE